MVEGDGVLEQAGRADALRVDRDRRTLVALCACKQRVKRSGVALMPKMSGIAAARRCEPLMNFCTMVVAASASLVGVSAMPLWASSMTTQKLPGRCAAVLAMVSQMRVAALVAAGLTRLAFLPELLDVEEVDLARLEHLGVEGWRRS